MPKKFVTVLIVATLVVASCGSEKSSQKAEATHESGTPKIVVIAPDSFVIDPAVLNAVEKKLGIKLSLRQSGDASAALSAAVLQAGRPEGDILFGVDNTLLSRAISGNVFDKVAASDIPNLAEVPKTEQLDSTGRLVPIDVAPVCVDYDDSWFKEHSIDPPEGWADLIDPRYKDLTVIENPTTSSTGVAFLLTSRVALGAGAVDWWRQLQANGVAVAGGWSDAWEVQYTVSGGTRPIVVSYATSPPAEIVYGDGKVTTPKTKVVDATCAQQVEFAGVLRGAKHPVQARQVLNEMLSEQWQTSQPLSNFVYPVRSGVTLPDVFTRFAVRPTSTIYLDPDVIDQQRDKWLAEWRSLFE